MRPPWTRGRAVVDGVLRYVSPSQIVSADHSSYGGCLRRWWYRRVGGKSEPQIEAAKSGEEGHAQIEEYLRTGKMVLGSHALAVKRFLPDPDPTLPLEVSIDDGALTSCGLPVVGFVDYLNLSRAVQLDHAEVYDPARSAEVVDWKFTGRKEYPSPREVAEALPMVAYGEWVARNFDLEWIRLSHVYISTRRREATKRSVLVRRSDLLPRWERAEGVVRLMQATAKASCADDVEPNLDACTAYGGCPHRSYCSAGEQRTLVDLLGPAMAQQLLAPKEKEMSLLNIPALAALKSPVEEAKAQLLAEEAAAKAPPVDPAVKAAVEAIIASGYGTPTVGAKAAKAWAAATGIDLQSSGLMGTGKIASVELHDPADLIKLATELSGLTTTDNTPAVQQTGLLPPDAPASDPVAALAAMEGQPSQKVEATEAPMPAAALAPAPWVDVPVPTITTTEILAASEAPAQFPPFNITGFAPETIKSETPSAPDEIKLSKKARAYVDGLLARIAELEARPAVEAPASPQGISVYVDCIPDLAMMPIDIAPWVQAKAKSLADRYGAADVRCASNDTPLGFGKWKGALAALLREAALADGFYFLDTRGSEILEVAAEALRARAQVTRGIR